MMDEKETEAYLDRALNAQKPDGRVLDRAKAALIQNTRPPKKSAWRFYAAAAASACLLVLGGIAAVFSALNRDSGFQSTQAQAVPSANPWLIPAIVLLSVGVLLGAAAVILRLKKRK